MSLVSIPTIVPIPCHSHRFADNGAVPHIQFYTRLAGGLNIVGRYRFKPVFVSAGRTTSIRAAGGAGSRTRWRTSFHTGKLQKRLAVYLMMAKSVAADPYAKVSFSGGLSDVLFHYGAATAAPADVPSEWGHSLQLRDCSEDTDYDVEFNDVDSGRLISGSVWALGDEEHDTAQGYLRSTFVVGEPILDNMQQSVAQLGTDMINRNGATCWTWCSDVDSAAFTRTSTTDINIIDNSSTAVSANTPGATLDNRYKNTAGTTTVPYRFKAYGKVAAGAGGHVYLKDSGGSVLATLTINGTVDAYYTTTVSLPNTEAKYDLHADGDGVNLMTLKQVGLYMHA